MGESLVLNYKGAYQLIPFHAPLSVNDPNDGILKLLVHLF